MADREKVIKGLEICKPSKYSRACGICPYREEMNCDYEVYNDALALLKEQEAVKPKKVKGFNPPIYLHLSFICDNCKTDLITNQPYCSGCGRPVLWEIVK